MATVILQAAGAAIGGTIGGPIGAALGRAAGAALGAYVDQQLFGPGDQVVSGPRLENAKVLTSREGASIPQVFGVGRIAGEIIWATRFEETISSRNASGGKGGGPNTTVQTYSYFANVAIGLCEGEIGGIGRIWADGALLDQTKASIRLHRGTEDQLPDSLIEAKQGVGNAPSYRGCAYVVFENLALETYGNRIPQISVEVIRPVGKLEKFVRGVNMIPGASEFAYETQPVIERTTKLAVRPLNVHQTTAETDFIASLNELQAVCPNLEQVALVVAWFGDDLRAGECTVRPKVEVASRDQTSGPLWRVGSTTRDFATLVSTHDGNPALGGTPSDDSVLAAIAELKARGLRVCLNPFLMMDVPGENSLDDPYGAQKQDAYPWRGRITSNIAPGQPASHDRTAAARTQVQSFVGIATRFNIFIANGQVNHFLLFEWSYRRFILHYARLAELAGGVDMFLIGSEMRGLTALRDENDAFPFVEALSDLASDIRPILGPDCTITYGADWSEYFGFHPPDGSNDVFFNLDPLWANPDIDAVGIDNYLPASDFRHGVQSLQGWRASCDPDMLRANIGAGEGYDWYYASEADRTDRVRTPISDALGEPWIYRPKDILNWWQNPHHERIGGVRQQNPTDWVPQSKPVIFTEFGCPAVHNGAAQPNVFHDPKSSESRRPHFSNGGRDDFAQAAWLHAMQAHWDPEHPEHNDDDNPHSSVTATPMVDMARSQIWAWDARHHPAYPLRTDVWSDHANWYSGHWLNGRLGRLRIADLIEELANSSGVADVDVRHVYGMVDGFVLADNTTARSALDALILIYRISVHEDDGTMVFRSPGNDPAYAISAYDLVDEDNAPRITTNREQESDLPAAVSLQHEQAIRDYQSAETTVRRTNGTSLSKHALILPVALSGNVATSVLESWLKARWIGRDTISFALARNHLSLTVGDALVLEDFPERPWQIVRIEEGFGLRLTARAFQPGEALPASIRVDAGTGSRDIQSGPPIVTFLDLPFIRPSQSLTSNLVAVAAAPWPGPMALFSSPTEEGYSFRQEIELPATMGELVSPLPPTNATSRWDRASVLDIELYDGTVFSAEASKVFAGANALAILSALGSWEVLQFQSAEPVAANRWRLQNLLRGQVGTEAEALLGAPIGARVVVLDQAVEPIANSAWENGLDLNWLAGPVGSALGDPDYAAAAYAPGARGLMPFRPVHLKAHIHADGSLDVRWIRRDRLYADDWSLEAIGMSEQEEAYDVRLSASDGTAETFLSNATNFNAPAATLAPYLGGSHLTVEVAQRSALVGPGSYARTELELN